MSRELGVLSSNSLLRMLFENSAEIDSLLESILRSNRFPALIDIRSNQSAFLLKIRSNHLTAR